MAEGMTASAVVVVLLALAHTAAAASTATRLGVGMHSFVKRDFGKKSSLRPAAASTGLSPAATSAASSTDPTASYQQTFEVLRPVPPPAPGQATCTVTLMKNVSFGSASGGVPYVGSWVPPTACGQNWSKVVLTFNASSIGVQYDRIVSINIGGLELLRSSTEEPNSQGVKWTVKIDITKYTSFLKNPGDLVVFLQNYVYAPYTGYYNTYLTITVYQGTTPTWVADKIYPISPPCSAADQTCFFSLTNGSAPAAASLPSGLSKKIVRAQLEITPHHGGYDEFYYTNPPDQYIHDVYDPSEWSQVPGGGCFREVEAFIDGTPVGTVWNYPIIFTGGLNPYFWEPVVGIGAFVLPTYTIDVTPFAALLLKNATHVASLNVPGIPTNGAWTLKAALHVWEDHVLPNTTAKPASSQIEATVKPTVTIVFSPDGIDATITTTATRTNTASGVVISSLGTLTWTTKSTFALTNVIVFQNYTNIQTVTQTVTTSNAVTATDSSGKVVYKLTEAFQFPLKLFTDLQAAIAVYVELGTLTHGFNYNRTIATTLASAQSLTESLTNTQTAHGTFNNIAPGTGGSSQNYTLRSTTSDGCYSQAYSQEQGIFFYNVNSTAC